MKVVKKYCYTLYCPICIDYHTFNQHFYMLVCVLYRYPINRSVWNFFTLDSLCIFIFAVIIVSMILTHCTIIRIVSWGFYLDCIIGFSIFNCIQNGLFSLINNEGIVIWTNAAQWISDEKEHKNMDKKENFTSFLCKKWINWYCKIDKFELFDVASRVPRRTKHRNFKLMENTMSFV